MTDSNIIRVYDKRLIPHKNKYAAVRGAAGNIRKIFTSSNVSSTSIQIQANPPSSSAIMDRSGTLWEVSFNVRVTGVPNLNPPISAIPSLIPLEYLPGLPVGTLLVPIFPNLRFVSGYFAPRANALSYVTQSVQIQLGQSPSFAITMSQIASLIQRFDNKLIEREQSILSGEPCMLDDFQNYEQALGSARNPFANFGEITEYNPRGYFAYRVINDIAGGFPTDINNTSFAITFYEPLMLSPFLYEKDALGPGITGISTFQLQFNFATGALFQRLFCFNARALGAPTIDKTTGLSITPSASSLHCTFLSAATDMAMPDINFYPYYQVVNYPQNAILAASNDSNMYNKTGNQQFQNVQLSSIPMAIYVYMRVSDSKLDWTMPDVATAAITKLTLQFDNTPAMISEYSAIDLYSMTVRNGFNGSFSEYMGLQANGCGSWLKIVPGIDFPLGSNLCPGTLGNYQLQMSVDYTICANLKYSMDAQVPPQPIPGTNPDMQFNVVIVSEGTMVVDKGNVILSLGFLTPETIASAPIDLTQSYIYNHSVLGGSFFSKLKDFARGAWDVGKKAVSGIRSVLDSGILDKLPLPAKYKAIVSGIEGANRTLKEHGYGATGGKKIKKGILKRRAMGYGHIEDNMQNEDDDPYTMEDEQLLSQIVENKRNGKSFSKNDDAVARFLMEKREKHSNSNGGYNIQNDEDSDDY